MTKNNMSEKEQSSNTIK